MKLRKIISGGQTGADTGGLKGAKRAGVKTGGYACRNYMTEDGPNPDLGTVFGLTELDSTYYSVRTIMNVMKSDATVVFGASSSNGSRRTIMECRLHKKPHLVLEDLSDEPELARRLHDFIVEQDVRVLNVAGNRESVYPGIEEKVNRIIFDALTRNAEVG